MLSGSGWSRAGTIVAGVLLAQVGLTADGHSQSAGSIGVRVNIVEGVDVLEAVRAVKAVGDQEGQVGQDGQGGRAVRSSSQPAAGRPLLVEVEPPREALPGEIRVRRVTVVVP